MKNMKKQSNRMLSLLLVLVLFATAVLTLTSCGKEPLHVEGVPSTANVMGEGTIAFGLRVIDKDGNEEWYAIGTDKTNLGEALIAIDLIAGEQGAYGLYVKTVCGKTLDWDTDGKYWALYIGEEMAMTGVDGITIEDGQIYTFRAE